MGSFNSTCAATLTPILYGEHVRMIVLCQTSKRMGTNLIHSTDLWTPISLPMPGTYDGYGRAALTTEGEAIYQQFRAFIQPKLLGHIPQKDQRDHPEHIRFQEGVQDGALQCATSSYFRPDGQEGLRMATVLVHEEAYEALAHSLSDPYEDTIDTPESLVAASALAIDALAQQAGKPISREALCFPDPFYPLFEPQRGTLAGLGLPVGTHSFLPLLATLFSNPATIDQGRDLLTTLAAFAIFHGNFTALRRVYAPTLTSGQDEDYGIYQRIAEVTANIIDAQSAPEDED